MPKINGYALSRPVFEPEVFTDPDSGFNIRLRPVRGMGDRSEAAVFAAEQASKYLPRDGKPPATVFPPDMSGTELKLSSDLFDEVALVYVLQEPESSMDLYQFEELCYIRDGIGNAWGELLMFINDMRERYDVERKKTQRGASLQSDSVQENSTPTPISSIDPISSSGA